VCSPPGRAASRGCLSSYLQRLQPPAAQSGRRRSGRFLRCRRGRRRRTRPCRPLPAGRGSHPGGYGRRRGRRRLRPVSRDAGCRGRRWAGLRRGREASVGVGRGRARRRAGRGRLISGARPHADGPAPRGSRGPSTPPPRRRAPTASRHRRVRRHPRRVRTSRRHRPHAETRRGGRRGAARCRGSDRRRWSRRRCRAGRPRATGPGLARGRESLPALAYCATGAGSGEGGRGAVRRIRRDWMAHMCQAWHWAC